MFQDLRAGVQVFALFLEQKTELAVSNRELCMCGVSNVALEKQRLWYTPGMAVNSQENNCG